MSSVIEPIHLVAAKEQLVRSLPLIKEMLAIPAMQEHMAENNLMVSSKLISELDAELAATPVSSQSEQVVATIAPPIQSHVVAQIPAVDYNVDAPVEQKIINHQVLSSKIVNPA